MSVQVVKRVWDESQVSGRPLICVEGAMASKDQKRRRDGLKKALGTAQQLPKSKR